MSEDKTEYVYTLEDDLGKRYSGYNRDSDFYPTTKGPNMMMNRILSGRHWASKDRTYVVKRYYLAEDLTYNK